MWARQPEPPHRVLVIDDEVALSQALHRGLQGSRSCVQAKKGGEGAAGQALITNSLEVRLIENRAIEVHHRRAGSFWPQG